VKAAVSSLLFNKLCIEITSPIEWSPSCISIKRKGLAMTQAYPNILLVGSDPDGSLLGEMLTHYAAVTRVEGISEALANLETKDYDVLFCQWEIAEESWKSILQEIQKRGREMPVIVFSHCGGEREWTQVLEAGAFDLLVPPYRSYQILTVLEHALASRRKMADCRRSA